MNEEIKRDGMNSGAETEETAQEEAEKAEDRCENESAGEEETGTETAEQAEEDEALNAKYLRLMADFQNYKRRTEKEKSDIYAYANEKIISELLNVIDNFERALQHECSDERYVEGMAMIFKQFSGVLEKAGLEEIAAEGEDFDPNFHNAVMTEDNPDFESGKVTGVLQKGYLLNKKVIRPSMVKVNN
ncbi:MAG: nucleotide exchange factor GrpE [Eubacteriaceae bacterium]|nr:nucleotide exchange factor GrpE [Eubacteriaceae bacterium]